MKPAHALEAIHWLGLQPRRRQTEDGEELAWGGFEAVRGIEPEGSLHHGRRGALVVRHTATEPGSKRIEDAIAKAYPPHRESRLLQLLRPHLLDDAFWRIVYALMVQGGPRIDRDQLVAMVIRLTQPDLGDAREEAARLTRRVMDAHHRAAKGVEDPASEPERPGRGRPPVPEDEKARQLKITLSPAALAKLEMLGANKSAAIERLIMQLDTGRDGGGA